MLTIGIDLDNTLICYDRIYEHIAKEKGLSVDAALSAREALKRDCFKQSSGNLLWTLIQGEVYGKRLLEAHLFPSALEVLKSLLKRGFEIRIISHKTYYSAVGEVFNLRLKAQAFIENRILTQLSEAEQKQISIHFCASQEDKLDQIKRLGCRVFIDDLKTVLNDEFFPLGIKKILFSPQNKTSAGIDYVISNWKEIFSYLESFRPATRIIAKQEEFIEIPSIEKLHREIDVLLNHIGFKPMCSHEVLSGGINNKAYKIETECGKSLCAKLYKRKSLDRRDRMRHEVAFLEFAKARQMDAVPRIQATDWTHRIVLMDYINGQLWEPEKAVSMSIWKQFIEFFECLQSYRNSADALALPRAAEGARSIKEHLAYLQQRRDYWRNAAEMGKLESTAQAYILDVLEDEYQKVATAAIGHKDFSKAFCEENKVISPSDFGLHNALIDPLGKVWFIDFEYAGWDDAAKAQIDFFLQPRYPAPDSLNWPSDRSNDEDYSCIKAILELKWKYIIFSAHQNIELPPK